MKRKTISSVRWMSGGPPQHGYITGVVLDPFRPNTLYARSDVGGLFCSQDGGETWENRNKGLAPSLVKNPPQTRYYGRYDGYWHLFDGRYGVSGFAVDPFDRNHFLLTTGVVYRTFDTLNENKYEGVWYGELFESNDAAASWTKVNDEIVIDGSGMNRVHGTMLCFDPREKNRVYAGTTGDGLFQSEDGGHSFSHAGLRGTVITDIKVHPVRPGTVAVASSTMNTYWGMASRGGVILVDMDKKEVLGRTLDGIGVRQLAVSDSIWYAACEERGLARSEDAGRTWTWINEGLPLQKAYGYFMGFNAVGIDPNNPKTVYTACREALCISRDAGRNWEVTVPNPDRIDATGKIQNWEHFTLATSSFQVDPQNPEYVYMSDFLGVWRSRDGGRTWKACTRGIINSCLKSLAPLEGKPGRVLAGSYDTGVLISDDSGITWKSVVGKWDAGCFYRERRDKHPSLLEYLANTSALCQVPNQSNTVFCGICISQNGGPGALLRSVDYGTTWEIFGKGYTATQSIKDIVVDPLDSKKMYLSQGGKPAVGGGIYASEDGGETWRMLDAWFTANMDFFSENFGFMERSLAAAPDRSGILAAGNRIAGVYQSLDGGKIWQDISAGLPVVTCGGITTLTYGPDGSLWAGTHGQGLWRRDAAQAWKQIFCGDYRDCTAVAVHPKGFICACFSSSWITVSKAGVLLSRDGGNSWCDLMNDTLTHKIIVSVAFDPENLVRIYVGTAGNGVFAGQVRG